MISHVDDSKGQNEDTYYDNLKTEITWQHRVLLNRPLKVIIVLFLTSVVAPLLIYKYIFFKSVELTSSDGYSFGSCLLPRESRLLCGLKNVNETNCDPQCCYDLDKNICYHRFPSRFTYLTPRDQEWDESTILHPRIEKIPYNSQESLPQVRISFDEVSSTHLSFTIYNSELSIVEGKRIAEKQYSYEVSSPEFNIVINGTHGNNSIFSTMRGPFIASSNIWEISFVLTQESMYGLGEIPLKANTTKIFYNHVGGLRSVPLIFAKSGDEYHGLLMDILEPTQLSVLEENRVVVRSITNKGLKFHLFIGPRPEDIMREVANLIGIYDALEYWMLGAHICNEFPTEYTTSYKNLEDFLTKSSKENVPFDSHCGVQPIVFKNQIENAVDDLFNERELLRIHQKRFVPHISPYVRYHRNYDNKTTETIEKTDGSNELMTEKFEGSFFLELDGTLYKGEIDGQTIVYPDYDNISTEFIKALWPTNTKIDGLVLENSWPVDRATKNLSDMYNSLPYFDETFENPFEVTPKWNIYRPNGKKYFYEHNAYGNHFAQAFEKISEDNIPISTSSQWMNGKVAVNVQHMDASWANLQRILTETALGGISGHRFWSTPICGDTEMFDPTTQTELCIKWYMAATYLPMIKIYSKSVERHPLAFKGTSKNYIFKALTDRISLLPYFFTTLQEGPLLRPMFYQFPTSENLKDLASQFSIGENLLIVPNFLPSQSHVRVWLPPGTWYEFWSGLKLIGSQGDAVTMATTEADLLTLIHGGSIVTLQRDVKPTSEQTRLHSDFTLIIALKCEYDETNDKSACSAFGHLYITKDMSIIFTAHAESIVIETRGTNTSLKLLCDSNSAVWAHVIKELYIYGLGEEMNNYDHHRRVTTNIDLCDLEKETSISFSYVN